MDIKISIIVPCYNADKFIERCIKSIINQSLEKIELIVINDGSTDNSLEIINKFKGNKIIKIISKQNEGLTKTRNIGLSQAKGEYIYFVDADDYLEDKFALEKLYNIASRLNLDILVFDYFLDNGIEKKYTKSFKNTEEIIIDKKIYFKALIEKKYLATMWNKIIRKNLFTENNILFLENVFMQEDLNASLKLVFCAKRIGRIKEALYNYVIHEEQGTRATNKDKIYRDCYIGYVDLKTYFQTNEEILDLIDFAEWELFYQILKPKNKKLKIYREVKDKLKNTKIKFYRKWSLRRKLKFLIRLIF